MLHSDGENLYFDGWATQLVIQIDMTHTQSKYHILINFFLTTPLSPIVK